ncbi:basic helix-loop-helix and HMG box domain-containing 1 [Labeo rohita]|uniref:Basic helix-loop-helix and HMG box domain-containing 1 n=1 Tax=Labeo rohita TaxID=84645 RepID=A0A498NC76_LABRO|nr:basic helix-loop-helix and HMG box domain-containing 1 [Labeo rohita]
MLQCFDIHSLKSHPHRLSENNEKKSESESEDTPLSFTPPQFLKAKTMYTYSRINKYTVQLSDKKRDPQRKHFERFIINAVEEQEHQAVCDGQSGLSEVQIVDDKDLWPVDDSQPSQSSLDSNSTTSSFNTGSTEAESTCSVCEDQTGSEDGSPGGNMLDTPPSSLKAWSYSCQQNRNVRAQVHEAEMTAGRSMPSPLHMLLAYRDKYAAVK